MTLRIGSIEAAPGQKAEGYINLNVGGVSIPLPIVLFNGDEPGPRLTVTAALHGTEYVGVEALHRVIKSIDARQLRGQLVACPLVNPPSFFNKRIAFSPLDGINPNRVFPGQPTGRPTERLTAWVYENLIQTADVFIDLHGGEMNEGMLPWTSYRSSGDDALDRQTLEISQAFGLPYVLRSESASGGNSHAAGTRAGVPSILVEIGGGGSRTSDEIRLAKDGIFRVMNHLQMTTIDVPAPPEPVQNWRWVDFVIAPVDGLWYPRFQIGDDLTESSRIGSILDPLGHQIVEVTAPTNGKVFYGVRGLAVTAGDVLAGLGTPEEV